MLKSVKLFSTVSAINSGTPVKRRVTVRIEKAFLQKKDKKHITAERITDAKICIKISRIKY